ncbi:MAG: GTP cyclohydrolase I FolE2 [Candidatus Thermoplasmatota archaeon]|nr:GTP cyclohydrolase I FolE2 [Candidatus Thermoplasmatota archaeon]MBU1941892.1 GTP cyclohydrolase I FolE2 [Candidatus Thermoplasmatota archaeon]
MNYIKSTDLPDVQARISPAQFKITRVGVTGVKKLVHIKRPNKNYVIPLVVTIDLFVDLPAKQRGSHMSRNLELISEIIDQNLKQPVSDLETFCAKTALLLLTKHDYATFSEIKAEADYFVDVIYPNGKIGSEPYKLIAEARAKKNGGIKKLIGVKVIGMTACPCAMEVVKTLNTGSNTFPSPTHNQRNIGTLMIEVPENETSVDADDLIKIVEQSFSSPTYSLLKRREEAELVLTAHKQPKFVEDVVRDILKQVLKTYHTLPDDVIVIAQSESEESIHKHNAFAERITTLGELRQ